MAGKTIGLLGRLRQITSNAQLLVEGNQLTINKLDVQVLQRQPLQVQGYVQL